MDPQERAILFPFLEDRTLNEPSTSFAMVIPPQYFDGSGVQEPISKFLLYWD